MFTNLTLATGTVLTITGVAAYLGTGATSLTALIPSGVGVLLLIAGIVSRNPRLHRHASHAALAIALLGALGAVMNTARITELFAGTAERPGAIVASVVMFVVLVAYLAFGIASFVRARRWRATDAGTSA